MVIPPDKLFAAKAAQLGAALPY